VVPIPERPTILELKTAILSSPFLDKKMTTDHQKLNPGQSAIRMNNLVLTKLGQIPLQCIVIAIWHRAPCKCFIDKSPGYLILAQYWRRPP
jgi:hypothetical protein